MRKASLGLHLTTLAACIVLHMGAYAQPVSTPQLPLPLNQLPTPQTRIRQLQEAGIPESQINSYLQGINLGAIGPVNQPGTPASAGSGFPAPQPAAPAGVQLEGTQPVLDEDEAEFEDKPKQITQINLAEAISSNVFGHRIFADTTFAYDRVSETSVPENYLIGPGDVFTVTVYGPSELYEKLTVESDGSVMRQYLGKIFLGGRTFAEAREILTIRYRTAISSRSNIDIQLSPQKRSIRVNIVGEVRRPGSYEISPSIPAFNALFFAAGVNDIGSVRNIQIKRNGQTVQVLDLYDYLIQGNEPQIYLQDNDFIFVPVQGKVVEVSGAVKRPAGYELRDSENLKNLLAFAGGLNYDALISDVQLARLEDSYREVQINFDMGQYLRDPAVDYKLQDGDRLIIRTVNKGAFNIVQVFGNVEYPGTYQLNDGERVLDLIDRAGGLGIDAYLPRAYVVRILPRSSELEYIPIDLSNIIVDEADSNNLVLQYFDALLIFSEADFKDERYISVVGQVRKPGYILTTPDMTLKDLLFLVNGFKEDADLQNIELSTVTRAEFLDIARLRRQQAGNAKEGDPSLDDSDLPAEEEADDPLAEIPSDEQTVQRIGVSANWQTDPRLDTLRIRPFDRMKVYSKYDFITPGFITIEGAVNRPGRYQLKRGMSLKDLLYLAGGLTRDADVNEVELYRDIDLTDRGNFNTKPGQKEIVRVKIDEDWQRSLSTDTLSLEAYHRVVIRSDREFFVPGYVTVKGFVNKPGRYEVLPDMTLKDLIYQAEGIQIEADFDRIELSRIIEVKAENGEVIPVPVVINTVTTIQDWQNDANLDQIKVNSFDQVFIRRNPKFELQESVFIEGEIIVPGEYNKSSKSERLTSLVSRAGGLSDLAYVNGAFLKRREVGPIAIRLEKALRRPGSRFDIPLHEGDTLIIPARLDVVTITGNVRQPNTTVVFEPGNRRLKYYVNSAGGFAKRSRRSNTTVTYMDGRVRPVRGLIFRHYPPIEQGAIVYVDVRPPKSERNPISVRNTIQEAIATLTPILTFYLLISNTLRQ